MKRLGLVMVIAGIGCIIFGFAFNFCVKLNAFEEFFLKSRLTDIIEGKGYRVVWERKNYKEIPLALREGLEKAQRGEIETLSVERVTEELEKARLIHFIETAEMGMLFFFEQAEYLPKGAVVLGLEKTDIPERPDPLKVPILHAHDGYFKVRVGGRLNIRDQEEVGRVFPLFGEAKRIGDWPGEVGRRWLRRYAYIGMALLLLASAWTAFFQILPSAVKSMRRFPRRGQRTKIVESFLPRDSVRIVDAKVVTTSLSPGVSHLVREGPATLEEQRQLLTEELTEMIAQSSGKIRTALTEILSRLEREPRLSKIHYLVKTEARAIISGKGREKKGRGKDEEPPLFIEKGVVDSVSSFEIQRIPLKSKLEDLLPIDPFIPENLNPAHVKTILLWGFLRPGEGKRFFGEHYLPYVTARRNVERKGVPSREIKRCVDWLMRVGVILDAKPNQGKLLCSLNPDPESVSHPGSDIIREVVRAARALTKRP